MCLIVTYVKVPDSAKIYAMGLVSNPVPDIFSNQQYMFTFHEDL